MNEPIHCQFCGFEVDPTISGEPNSWPNYAELEALVAKQNEAAEQAAAVIKELGELNSNLMEQITLKNSNETHQRVSSALLVKENSQLRGAIAEHHRQKADDRCWEDDDKLYAAAGLPPCDRRVGDKAEMLKNCERFIARRCEGGHWPSYAELEKLLAELTEAAKHDFNVYEAHRLYTEQQRQVYEDNIARDRAANQKLTDDVKRYKEALVSCRAFFDHIEGVKAFQGNAERCMRKLRNNFYCSMLFTIAALENIPLRDVADRKFGKPDVVADEPEVMEGEP